MQLSIILVPLFILVAGILTFFVLPLDLPIRLLILGMDVVGAIVVGAVLWLRALR